ncbi:MAG: hypothetical protein UZ19_OD1000305 [Parcubacteria bacterium OLB19]|nr:MAG: hypothetical protein UZ19_OD1000305 [Parcubacteria bacterium OLB19]
MQPKKLENYKVFPFIAWTICVLFAGFVGLLSLEMKQAITELQTINLQNAEKIDSIEKKLDQR